MLNELFGPNELNFMVALIVALICGLLVGGERELRKKPAGMSTQTLVIGGAMLFAFLSHTIGDGDPTRIAAQVVTGIGFLGAGIILKSETSRKVTNVTTAASIWYSAAIGMAIGFHFYVIAIVAALAAVVIARIPHIDKKYKD
ncbi:MAG: MgtC/SapB family protein [Candidatus Saccharimonadales bacterium]